MRGALRSSNAAGVRFRSTLQPSRAARRLAHERGNKMIAPVRFLLHTRHCFDCIEQAKLLILVLDVRVDQQAAAGTHTRILSCLRDADKGTRVASSGCTAHSHNQRPARAQEWIRRCDAMQKRRHASSRAASARSQAHRRHGRSYGFLACPFPMAKREGGKKSLGGKRYCAQVVGGAGALSQAGQRSLTAAGQIGAACYLYVSE